MRRLAGTVLLWSALVAGAGQAVVAATSGAEDPANLCLSAARAAAKRHGVPPQMMQAITLVETRRPKMGGGPWPWTLNVEGKGHWFETRAAALARAEREFAAGRRSVDLGCFQLNYRWHGANFASPDAMLEPALAADYAARFLGKLYAETGDWMRAAGHYHSRTPVHAARYTGLVRRTLARLGADLASAAPDSAPAPGPRASREEAPAVLAMVRTRAAADPVNAAAPGAVMLSMFARPTQPLLATPGFKP